MSTLFATVLLALALNSANVAAAPQDLVFAKSACADFCATAQLTDGAPVVMAPCNSANVTGVTWSFDISASGSAPIRLTRGGVTKCLDVKDGMNNNGNTLQVWQCYDGAANQQFRISTDDTDAVIQWNAHPDKCLDLTDGREAAGTPVQIWSCNDDNENQVWDLSPVMVTPPTRPVEVNPSPNQERPPETGFSTVKILINSTTTSSGGPKCLGFNRSGNGASAVAQSCVSGSTTLSAAWSTRQPVAISDANGSFCLDLTDGNASNGNKLQSWGCSNGNRNQQWRFNTDGTISWGTSNLCLDLTDGRSSDGTLIQVWSCNNRNPNQIWTPAAVIP